MSHIQSLILSAIRFWFPDEPFVSNARPMWMDGLELDILLPNLRLAVEVQGRQHYQFCPDLQQDVNQFSRQRYNDGRKAGLCSKQKVRLLTISERDDRSFWGLFTKLRKMGFKLRRLPKDLIAQWRQHRRTLGKLADRTPRFKVKRDGQLVPCNKASANLLHTVAGSVADTPAG